MGAEAAPMVDFYLKLLDANLLIPEKAQPWAGNYHVMRSGPISPPGPALESINSLVALLDMARKVDHRATQLRPVGDVV